jgi:hypothetical protein
VNGGLNLLGEDYLNKSNPSAFVRFDRMGRLGIGTADPQRAIQIGSSPDAMFTIEPSIGTPVAGIIRFGDKSGWKLQIGRSREFSGGPLNKADIGTLFEFRDDGAFGPINWPLGPTGNAGPLCRTGANWITLCPSSSLRYKKDIKPYRGGLDVVDRLQPIAFTRIYNNSSDIGLAAEAVEQVDPRLTYPNETGAVEGIRYELLTTVLINAVKEQQVQIERQRDQIDELKSAVARLDAAQP